MSGKDGSVARVFGMPLALAVLTAFGLLAALLLEPFGRYVAWITLTLPIAITLWAYLRRLVRP